MLTLRIHGQEIFIDETNEFETIEDVSICLEHSLVSISKWESKWHKSFLSTKTKTSKELIDYIKCMTLTQNVNPKIYSILSKENLEKINLYIADTMTATTFLEPPVKEGAKAKKEEIVTAEVIYYWMVSYQIPFECQKWHLNRLLTLIKICSIKNSGGKDDKMSKKSVLASNRALNAARRQAMHTRG